MPGTEVTIRRLQPPRITVEEEQREARARFAGARIAAGAAPLSPRGVGQMLDAACDIFATRFVVCIAIGAFLMLPLQLGTEIVSRANLDPELRSGLIMLLAFLVFPVPIMTNAFVCAVIGMQMLGEKTTISVALHLALRRCLGVVLISFIASAVTAPLCLCCGINQYIAQYLSAAIPAVYLLERASLGDSIGRGLKLVWGWASFGRWIGWYSVAAVVVSPLSMVSAIRTNELGREFMLETFPALSGTTGIVLAFVEALFMGVAIAFPAVVTVVYYFDLRVRREGLDLEHQLARFEARRKGVTA